MYIFTNSSNLDKVLQSLLFFPKSLLNLHLFFSSHQWALLLRLGNILAYYIPFNAWDGDLFLTYP